MGRLILVVVISSLAVALCNSAAPAQESATADSNRDLAKWVMESRGQVGLLTEDGTHVAVKHVSEIPEKPFSITRIDLGSRPRLTDQDLEKLKGLSELLELNLSYTRITDQGLKSLKELPKLSRLYLAETKITDASLAEISRFENLASLDLSGTNITDKNLGELIKLKNLSRLFLGRTEITGAALKPLAQLTELAVLHLAGVQLTAEELGSLKSLEKLKELSLTTDDEALEKVQELASLKILNAHGGGITDQGMPALAKCGHLEQLRLSQTAISDVGLKLIKNSLGDAHIVAHPISRQSAFLMSAGLRNRPVMRWQPGHEKDAWMGLVPRPARLPGISRWQLESIEPRSEIRSVDFSPNGERVACGTVSGYVRIYDASNLSLVALIPAHHRGVFAVAWSPDGTQLATAGADAAIRIWNAEGNPIRVLRGHRSSVMSVNWSPDGQRLASGSWGNSVRVWKQDGSESLEFKGHEKPVYSVAWSPDGKQLASGSADRTIRIWDMTGKTLHTLNGHTDIVTSLAWNSRGSRLASGSWDKTIRFWNPRTGRPGPVLEGHTYRVYDLEWHPEGTMLASAGDRTLRLWTLDGTPVRTIMTEQDQIFAMSWKHDGKEIATGTRQNSILRITDVEGKTDRAIGENLNGGAVKLAWHPAGDRIAAGCRDRLIRLISQDGRPGAILKGHHYHVRTLDWSPDGDRLASGGDASMRIWNRQGVLLQEYKPNDKANYAVDWSPDGSAIVIVNQDQTAHILSPDGKKLREIKLPHPARKVKWGPDSQQFVTISDTDARIWNQDGTPGPVLSNPPRSLVTLDWNYATDQIAVGGWSQQYQTWNAEGEPGVSQKTPQSILDIAFSPKGDQVAIACFNSSLLFAKPDGSETQLVLAHAGPMTSLSWHPDGKTLVSSAYDNTLRFWDAKTREPKHVALFYHDGTNATLTAAGQIRYGDLGALENKLIYLVESDGRQELLSPVEFEKRLTGTTD